LPADVVLLHEAAHNAGAPGDVDKGKGYPPKNAVDNAYCYEYFVADVIKAEKERVPKLPPKKRSSRNSRDLVDLDWDET